MEMLDYTCPTPKENILLDEILFRSMEEDRSEELLRFWEAEQPFVVLGRTTDCSAEVKMDVVQADQIPVLRRCSGGGTVLQGRGCLNYALILRKDQHLLINDIRKSYVYISQRLTRALRCEGVESEFKETSDLAITATQQKFSGNAQRRGKKCILHHGTFLYNFDLSLIDRYLNIPPRVPPYRQGRGHLNFLTNINLSAQQIKTALAKEFQIQQFSKSLNDEQMLALNK